MFIENAGLTFVLYDEETDTSFTYVYENGIKDYLKELNEQKEFTEIQYYEQETRGRDREDKPEYKVKLSVAFCFSNRVHCCEYYSHHR